MTRKRQWGPLIGAMFLTTYMSAVAGLCYYASIMFAFEGRFWPMIAFDSLFVVAMWLTYHYNSLIMRLAS